MMSEEEHEFVEEALRCVDADSAGHWPTVAGWLAVEVRRLRVIEQGAKALVNALREEEWIQADGGSSATRAALTQLGAAAK